MSDHKPVTSGMMDLDTMSGSDLLKNAADMMYLAPEGSDPYIDISFKDTWGTPCVMRMYLYGGSYDQHPIH